MSAYEDDEEWNDFTPTPLAHESILSANEDDEEWNDFTPTPPPQLRPMSAYEKESPDAKPTPLPARFHLAAHTPNATAMTQKLINGTISQKDYDKRIMSTSIKLVTKVASMPVIMTLDDSLAEVLAQAVSGLDMSCPVRQQTRLYLWCSTKLVHSIGRMHCVSGRSAILNRSSLKDLYWFIRDHDPFEQLLVAYEDEIAAGEHYTKLKTRDENLQKLLAQQRPVQKNHWTEKLRRTREIQRAKEQQDMELDPPGDRNERRRLG